MIIDKKALATWKRNHELHVLLLMQRHNITKSAALVQAYAAGNEGLTELLGQGLLHVEPQKK